MKRNLSLIQMIILVLLISFTCVSCNEETIDPDIDDPIIDPIIIETPANVEISHTTSFDGSAFKFDVYYYTTNKEGPKIAVVGGIHGDEQAGWQAGCELVEKLKDEKGICGQIMLIPKVNTLACQALQRYKVTGYVLSDLNRSFPLGREDNACSKTIEISNEIISLVEAFDPDVIIDLHESRNSWTKMESGTKTSLGDTVIASNNSIIIRKILKIYNENYLLDNETEFRQEGSNQLGTFNYYFTNTYPKKTVLTIETNRDYRNNKNNIALEVRTRQQLNMLEALFDYFWERNK